LAVIAGFAGARFIAPHPGSIQSCPVPASGWPTLQHSIWHKPENVVVLCA
jgi:hypothetical protein